MHRLRPTAAAFLVAGLCTGCYGGPPLVGDEELAPLARGGGYRILEIVDVNTLGVDLDGNGAFDPATESVQLLGVEGAPYTAERTAYPSREAVAYLQQHLLDRTIILEDDLAERGLYRQNPPPEYAVTGDGHLTAEGGPWLAYAFVGPLCLNRELLEQGYGRLRIDIPFAKEAEFREAEARARLKRIGVWENP